MTDKRESRHLPESELRGRRVSMVLPYCPVEIAGEVEVRLKSFADLHATLYMGFGSLKERPASGVPFKSLH